ncbi:DUF4129 domain-containing protein [Brevibacillus borstelensis]|uniref:DUF4129 domain-containing protein n=1 Tax=Brevibacillus borstelensis TaxID=45462 RepID=UPI000468461D|nr:DUF4129 domain-containing protein [Brevibacillus borstelensis]MCC0564622.1 DUF4129 domain-containing protein [Brevibacillus borstelensis]MCM3470159.1 DUF4129 domain-containing protein [Brevibacillus borstelensis]MCM3557731.1 DUF4129 domain-containing protein [Brevibacillus borstelensis]
MIDSELLTQDKERLADILARDEFGEVKKQGKSWLDALFEEILDTIARMLQSADVSPGTASVLSKVIVAAAVIGVIVFLLIWWRRMVRRGPAENQLLAREERIRTYADYLREAKERGQKEDWREGVRYSFLALLSFMQERSWVRIESWKTNWEYLDELQARQPEWETFFRTHARLFEQVWYGRAELAPAAFWESLSELERRLHGEGKHDERR